MQKLKEKYLDAKRELKRFIQWRSFLWAIPLVFIFWHFINELAYYYDPTSKALDVGFIIDIAYAFLVGLGSVAFAMLGMRYIFKPLYDYYRIPTKNHLGEKGNTQMHLDFKDLFHEPQKHRWVRLFIFWLYFFSLVGVCLIALFTAR